MADLNDGPDQEPLDELAIHKTILNLIQGNRFDLVITHSPWGEYTRHRRHEETGKALLSMWCRGEIKPKEMWIFAYEDGQGAHLPKPEKDAHHCLSLPIHVWERKNHILTNIYGFSTSSWEARVSPKEEAFWCFRSPKIFHKWYQKKETANENSGPL